MKIMKMRKIILSAVIVTCIASMVSNVAIAGTKSNKVKAFPTSNKVTQSKPVVKSKSKVLKVPEITLSKADIEAYAKSGETLHTEKRAKKGISLQYSSTAHQKMAQRALTILKNDKGTSLYNKIVENFYDEDGYVTDGGQVVVRLAYETDDVENDFFSYLGHFYGKGGKNYLRLSSPTAYTRFNNHYSNAVNEYDNGNKFEAYEELGMAVHYLEDMNAPHHAANKIAILTNHTDYESWVDNTISNYLVSSASASDYNFICNSSIKTIADEFSALARDTYESCGSSNFQITSIGSTRNNCVRVQKAIAGLYYRFLIDTGRD